MVLLTNLVNEGDTVNYDPFEALLGKWRDVEETADDWAERNLAREIQDDITELWRDLNG